MKKKLGTIISVTIVFTLIVDLTTPLDLKDRYVYQVELTSEEARTVASLEFERARIIDKQFEDDLPFPTWLTVEEEERIRSINQKIHSIKRNRGLYYINIDTIVTFFFSAALVITMFIYIPKIRLFKTVAVGWQRINVAGSVILQVVLLTILLNAGIKTYDKLFLWLLLCTIYYSTFWVVLWIRDGFQSK